MRLKDRLKKHIPENLWHLLPRSYDLIGEAAVIELPEELSPYSNIIGEEIMKIHPRIRGVYAVREPTKGRFRIRPLKLIAGEQVKTTVHKEYNVKIFVELDTTYFNPSLGYEHYRVSESVKDGETVLDMFSGVGGFTLHIASKRRAKIIALDLNIEAIRSLKKSLELNKLLGTVEFMVGDARFAGSLLRPIFDRVIMDYPEASPEYLDVAFNLLREEGGVIHYYRFSDSIDSLIRELQYSTSTLNRRVVRIENVRVVLEASPTKRLYVVDMYVV